MHSLIPALSGLAATHSGASVRFVARELPFAREVLRELARERGALVGWEGTTLRQLAGELAAGTLDARGLRPADDLALQAAADDALDATASTLPAPLRRQVTSLGFRTAAFDAFAQLRVAGVTPEQLRGAARAGSPAEALTPTFARYCALLAERKLSDAADAFRTTIELLDSGITLDDVIVIEPGAADASGLPLALIEALRKRGALLVALNDARPDWSAIGATFEFSRAASPALEVRDALRHALASGLKWDEVEFAASDVNSYGTALASIGDELAIPYTLKEGVPMIRSRAGRAVERYLQWLEQGLPATAVREALEQGELPIGDTSVSGADVARAIRSAQIGWGRSRWLQALERFRDGAWISDRLGDRNERDDDETPEARQERLKRIAVAAAAVLAQLVPLMPNVPGQSIGDPDAERLAVSKLASLTIGWLTLISPSITSSGERHALERLLGRLAQLSEHQRPEVTFGLAVAELRQGVADLRAFPSTDGARARRTSAPGAVHLTDLSQAGSTGRRQLYLLGLDADRTSVMAGTDPILDEETRSGLGGALPPFRERVARRERTLFRALNALSGNVHLSYAAQGNGAGREASPAPFLLDAARRRFDKPDMTYDELRVALGEPAGAARGSAPLDRSDVWLRALAAGGDLSDGREQVMDAWPDLARGLTLHAAASANVVTEWHGIVPDAANKTGPFAAPGRWTSPSSLEKLAKCPLAWFYSYGLDLRLPDDVEFDAQQWIDPRQHGVLVHKILERFVRAWMPKQKELSTDQATQDLFAIAEEEIARQRAEIPPPSELVFMQQRELVLRSVRQFLAQERDHCDAEWIAVEAHFPAQGGTTTFTASDGTALLIGGYIDRVDRNTNGSLRIVDYKTGSSWRFRMSSKDAPLKGGRILQPAIYAQGASQTLNGKVTSFEYRFPKERAPYDRIALNAEALAPAPAIVTSLLTHLRTGNFIPTDDVSDCAYCDFRSICRVSGEQKKTVSPRAAWGAQFGEVAAEYVQLRVRRSGEGDA